MELTPEKIAQGVADLRFRTQAFIDGKFCPAISGKTFESANPATGKVICSIAECDKEDVDVAVAAAKRAFDAGVWSKLAPAERKGILLKFAQLMEDSLFELGLLDVLEAGKPISDTMTGDMPDSIKCVRWHAEAIDKVYDEVCPTGPDAFAFIKKEPIGVVGAVTPWNFPVQMACWKIAPALATGCSVVLKPSELTSLSALRMAELAHEAGIPAGVFNVVPGNGITAGQALGRHMDVDCAVFTGSTVVGRKFLQYAAESNLKKITLELGGKSPQVVFDDCKDLDSVAENVASAAFWNMAENCSCGSRLIVHKSIKDDLLTKVKKVCDEQWVVGDPLDPNTRVGALIEPKHLDKVMGYMEIAKQDGKIFMGGNRVKEETGGLFVELTIVDDVPSTSRVFQEEVFGPILAVTTFETEAEAIALANNTTYGLAASVYTDGLDRAHRVAGAIKAGCVSVNGFTEGDDTAPFGGYKSSGFAGRDKSIHAHSTYQETKTVWMCLR